MDINTLATAIIVCAFKALMTSRQFSSCLYQTYTCANLSTKTCHVSVVGACRVLSGCCGCSCHRLKMRLLFGLVHASIYGNAEVLQERIIFKLSLDLRLKVHHEFLGPASFGEELVSQQLRAGRSVVGIQTKRPLQRKDINSVTYSRKSIIRSSN